MDKPADLATPFGEVYQAFLDDLTLEGTTPRTIQASESRSAADDSSRQAMDEAALEHDEQEQRGKDHDRHPGEREALISRVER